MTELNKQVMIDSFRNISFNGERRGTQDYEYYKELLSSDLDSLGEKQGNYREKFIQKVMDIYYKQSSCTSSFIVGPANYNLRRHEKTWASRDKAYEHFNWWREKYFKCANRVRTLSPEAELDLIPLEIDELEKEKESIKDIIKELRKCNDEEEKRNVLKKHFPNSNDHVINIKLQFGISYQGITRKIRERKKKIEVMKARIEAKNNQRRVHFKGGAIYIENDRVIISHDEKPEKSIIQEIKRNGFRWSPKFKNWCRKHTANARRDANYLLNKVFGGEVSEVN